MCFLCFPFRPVGRLAVWRPTLGGRVVCEASPRRRSKDRWDARSKSIVSPQKVPARATSPDRRPFRGVSVLRSSATFARFVPLATLWSSPAQRNGHDVVSEKTRHRPALGRSSPSRECGCYPSVGRSSFSLWLSGGSVRVLIASRCELDGLSRLARVAA